jgi:hypothetical protein
MRRSGAWRLIGGLEDAKGKKLVAWGMQKVMEVQREF